MGSRADSGGLRPPQGSPDPPDTRPVAAALTCPGRSSTNSAPHAGSSGGCPAPRPCPAPSPTLRSPLLVHRHLEVHGNAWPVTVSSTGQQMQHLVSFANLLCRCLPSPSSGGIWGPHLEERRGVQQGPVSSQANDEINLVGDVIVI